MYNLHNRHGYMETQGLWRRGVITLIVQKQVWIVYIPGKHEEHGCRRSYSKSRALLIGRPLHKAQLSFLPVSLQPESVVAKTQVFLLAI